MSPRTVKRLALPTLAIASLALPGAALAKGGGGGGGGGSTTPPPPSTPPVLCDYASDGFLPDGSSIFSNQAGDAGCITVRVSGSTLRLYRVTLTPGWTSTVTSNGEGTNSRVAVDFNETATGRKVEARIEFGKTVIK
jgi:hypothetical protein